MSIVVPPKPPDLAIHQVIKDPDGIPYHKFLQQFPNLDHFAEHDEAFHEEPNEWWHILPGATPKSMPLSPVHPDHIDPVVKAAGTPKR